MKISLLGWTISGMRVSDMVVDLTTNPSTPAATSFVMMQNGTGKSTTSELLRATLSGIATKWTRDKVRSFQSPHKANDYGTIQVDLMINSNERLTYELNLDFETGEATYKTSYRHGQKPRFHAPLATGTLFNPNVIHLLVFNAELPKALLNRTEARADAVIDSFFHLYLFDHLNKKADEIYAEDVKRKGKGARTTTGISNLMSKETQIQDRLQRLYKQRDHLNEQRAKVGADLEKLSDQFKEVQTTNQAQKQRADKLKELANIKEQDLTAARRDAFEYLRSPNAVADIFRDDLVALRSSLDRLKLPARASKKFFEELIEESLCVCGRPLSAAERKNIEITSGSYLSDESTNFLNALKSDIDNHLTMEATQPSIELQRLTSILQEQSDQLEALRTEQEMVRQDVLKAAGREDLESRWVELEEELRKVETELQVLVRQPMQRDIGPQSDNILYWESELSQVQVKIAEAAETKRWLQAKNRLQCILARSKELSTERLRANMVTDTNAAIAELLPDHQLRISDIDRSVVLEAQSGASEGQTLAIGYAFLASLFKRGHHQVPFIVDAPVISLDSRVSREVAKLLPSVVHQFVGFVISRERADFTDVFETNTNGATHYYTVLDLKHQSNRDLANSKGLEFGSQDNALIVKDRNFFYGVSLGDEPEDETEL